MRKHIRPFVSGTIVFLITGMWAYLSLQGEPVNPLLFTVVILYALMAGYVVFGRRAFDRGQEALDALRDNESDDNGGEG